MREKEMYWIVAPIVKGIQTPTFPINISQSTRSLNRSGHRLPDLDALPINTLAMPVLGIDVKLPVSEHYFKLVSLALHRLMAFN